MIKPPGLLFILLLQVAAILSFAIVQTVVADKPKERPVPPAPTQPSSPSNARTESGETIPVEQSFSAKRCAGCHHDTHAAWSESLHLMRRANPFTAKASTFFCGPEELSSRVIARVVTPRWRCSPAR